jgi:hypothetical protein
MPYPFPIPVPVPVFTPVPFLASPTVRLPMISRSVPIIKRHFINNVPLVQPSYRIQRSLPIVSHSLPAISNNPIKEVNNVSTSKHVFYPQYSKPLNPNSKIISIKKLPAKYINN